MDHLDRLEAQSIFILREAYKKFGKLGMLWSIGKDSTVLLWLAKKAFFGHCPFPFIHVDTTYKIPEMIEYRDRIAKDYNLDLIVHTNEEALQDGMGPEHGRLVCCKALKTEEMKKAHVQRNVYSVKETKTLNGITQTSRLSYGTSLRQTSQKETISVYIQYFTGTKLTYGHI
jgi:3'-phosphoadenosine 5'-phosphosulfate sulfotransferase (PAPS reductase)/FAD synthetase